LSQIPLPLSFDKRFSLGNYVADNAAFIEQQLTALFDETGERLIGLHGGADSGKTHLVNACAHYARDCRIVFHLFDAQQLQTAKAASFEGFEPGSVIGVDNLDLLAGLRAWETQFYQLINRVRDGELRLVFTLARQPRDIGFRLPDLKSRLMWGLLISLKTTSDDQLETVLRKRARLLGLRISDGALTYLLSHYSRSLSDQMALLYRLDEASLSSQRRVTVPLIKQCLADHPG
jgi:DnaA family protein